MQKYFSTLKWETTLESNISLKSNSNRKDVVCMNWFSYIATDKLSYRIAVYKLV